MTLPPFVTHPTQVLENAIQFQRDLLSNKNFSCSVISFCELVRIQKAPG